MARRVKFSILTPTMNRPDLVQVAVESVLNQTHEDWELILYDVSDTPLSTHQWTDERVRCYRGQAAGPAQDFQFCLDQATGDVVTPLSDDDRLPSHALATVADAIGQADWLVARTVIHNHDGLPLHLRGGTKVSLEQTLSGQYMLGGAIYWRKTLSDRVGGFNPEYDGAADFDLYTRFAHAAQPAFVKDVLYLYRDHAGTDSRQQSDRQADASERIARGQTQAA